MGGCKNVTILATLVLWKSHNLENEVHPLIFQSNIRSQQLHLLDVLGFSGPEMEEWFIPLFCLRPGGREFELQIPLGQEYLVLQHLTPSLVGCGDLSRGGQKVLWVRTRTSLGEEPSFYLLWREKSLDHSVQLIQGMLWQIICKSVIFQDCFIVK